MNFLVINYRNSCNFFMPQTYLYMDSMRAKGGEMALFTKQKIIILLCIALMLPLTAGFTYDGDTVYVPDIEGKVITLRYLSNEYKVLLNEICITVDNNKISINEEFLMNKINEIAQSINKSPADASIIDEKTFTIQKEIDGVMLDGALLSQIIKGYLTSGSLVDDYVIDIPVIIEKPKVTESILNQIKATEISSFSTPFSPKLVDRTVNLRISTGTINGTIIYPGEIFSMDDALGERTGKEGYRYAPAFAGGQVVKSLAGGICQTTTTMYNAALFANMQIIERYKHGLPVTYINKGRDATIYRNVYDLKVKNNYSYPLYIKSWIDTKKGLLTVKIYGYKKEYNIKVTTEHYKKNNRNYYYTYRHVYDLNNVLIKKELISTDVFK